MTYVTLPGWEIYRNLKTLITMLADERSRTFVSTIETQICMNKRQEFGVSENAPKLESIYVLLSLPLLLCQYNGLPKHEYNIGSVFALKLLRLSAFV